MEILLGRDESFTIAENGKGILVVCREGALWITQAGDTRDHLLNAGERYIVRGSGVVVIEALRPAELRIERPEESFRPVRISPATGRASARISNLRVEEVADAGKNQLRRQGGEDQSRQLAQDGDPLAADDVLDGGGGDENDSDADDSR